MLMSEGRVGLTPPAVTAAAGEGLAGGDAALSTSWLLTASLSPAFLRRLEVLLLLLLLRAAAAGASSSLLASVTVEAVLVGEVVALGTVASICCRSSRAASCIHSSSCTTRWGVARRSV
jgi:hypothetical protein